MSWLNQAWLLSIIGYLTPSSSRGAFGDTPHAPAIRCCRYTHCRVSSKHGAVHSAPGGSARDPGPAVVYTLQSFSGKMKATLNLARVSAT